MFLSHEHEIEAFGTGIRRIYEECKKNDVNVEFKSDGIGFTVIFYRKNNNELEEVANENKNAGVNVGVNKTQHKILKLMTENYKITQGEIAEKLNKNLRTIEKNIVDLKKKKIIERVGSDKNGHWKIIKNEAKSEAKDEAKNEAKSEAKNEAKDEAKNEAKSEAKNDANVEAKNISKDIDEIDTQILNTIKQNPNLSQKEIAKQIEINRSMLQRKIRKLKEKGILIRKGSRRNGYWKIIK